ncbi:thymidylate synthase [Methanococcoides sp. SA1]|nr:thymidylate synthase [Methanococcoides sp. SA1]
MLQPIFIKATSLSDAWFQTLYQCVEKGRSFKIHRGSFEGQIRLEFDHLTIHIIYPDKGDLLPKVNPQLGFPDPVDELYLNDYLPYLMTGEEKEGESYTYGQRICKCDLDYLPDDYKTLTEILIQEKEVWEDRGIIEEENGKFYLNQMELMIWTYKHRGPRNNQMVLQVGQPSDMILQDPPCLRHIDTRIQDGKLHFFPDFRSWDLYGGLPANLAAIEMMKQYCAGQIGVENGEIFAVTKGGHIYDYVFEIAEAIRGRSMDEFREISTDLNK